MLALVTGPILLIGDFNLLEFSYQKQGGSNKMLGVQSFRNWKLEHGLNDIRSYGVPFTWTNNTTNEEAIFECLDRAYANDDWLIIYPDCHVWNYPIFISDHGPILFDSLLSNIKTKRIYRFENWAFCTSMISMIYLARNGKKVFMGPPHSDSNVSSRLVYMLARSGHSITKRQIIFVGRS